jgi:hypothetical protein
MPEIATITRHSLKDVEVIVDAHYLGRSTKLAVSAVANWSAPPRRREPMANKNLKTIKPFQMQPAASG